MPSTIAAITSFKKRAIIHPPFRPVAQRRASSCACRKPAPTGQMDLGDAGARAKFVLHDRDASFTQAFDAVFQAAGIRVIRSAVQAVGADNPVTAADLVSCAG
jgi:hypothetical protein